MSFSADAVELPLTYYMGRRTDIQDDESIAERWRDVVRGIRDEYLDPTHRFPWVVGFSGGKDSTVVAHGVFEALQSIPPSQRTREVHIVSNDTMVESPLVIAHLDVVTKHIDAAARNLNLPVTRRANIPRAGQDFLGVANWQRVSEP